MARALITPYTVTDMSSTPMKLSSDKMIKVSTADGAYIKTSGYDASRFIFVAQRSSKSGASAGSMIFLGGSTAGKADNEAGKYSTKRDASFRFPVSSVAASNKTGRYPQFIHLSETARFIDTDGYIKINFTTGAGSGGGTSHRCLLGAIYIAP
jgi:hypothetical protein